jgi:hypothetical protein
MGSPRPPTFSIFGRQHPGARQVPRWDSKSTWSTTHTRSAAMPSSHGDQLVPTPRAAPTRPPRYRGRWRASLRPWEPPHRQGIRPTARRVTIQIRHQGEAGLPSLELARSGTLMSGGPLRRSALGPGSPTGSRRCSQKAFSVGSNPTRGTSRDTIQSLAIMSVAAENIFSCTLQPLSILQRACPT